MQAIGKNRELTLTQVRENTGEFAVTLADPSMTPEQLQAGYDAIMKQLEFWGNEATNLKFGLFSGDKKELANITEIINIQSERLAPYIELMQAASGGEMFTEDGVPVQSNEGVNFNISPLWIFGGLAIYALVAGGDKNKKRMGSKKDKNSLWLLLLGGGALYLITRTPKAEGIYVQPTPDNVEMATPSTGEPEPIYYVPAPMTDDAYQPNEPAPPMPIDETQYTGEPMYYNDGGLVVFTDELIHPRNP